MKKTMSFILTILVFTILGCSFGTSTKKEETAKSDKTSSDSKPSSDKDSKHKNASGKADLSMEKFSKMKLDMSYEEVKGIIGADGKETASSSYGDTVNKSYEWDGGEGKKIYTRFKNDKMTSLSQSLLGPKEGTADVTLDKINKVQLGMSYEKVKNIIGSEGEMTSTTKFGDGINSRYVWKGKGYARFSTFFEKDKLSNKSQTGVK